MLRFPVKRLVLLGVVATIALGIATYVVTAKQVGGTLVLLIDHSPSDSEGTEMTAVRSCADAVIHVAVRQGATIYVGQVSRMSNVNWTSVHSALTGAGRSNSDEAATQQGKAIATADQVVARILRASSPPGGSDYLAATAAAARLLMQEPGRMHILAICGDLNSVGSGINLYRDVLSPEARRKIISRLRPILPDFKGAVDVVAGAAGLDRVAVPTDRAEEIQQFWTRNWAPAVHVRTMSYDSVPHMPR